MKLKNSFIALVFGVFAASSLAASSMEGQLAPDFALKDTNGVSFGCLENQRFDDAMGVNSELFGMVTTPAQREKVQKALMPILAPAA